jgi:hypothetical protein
MSGAGSAWVTNKYNEISGVVWNLWMRNYLPHSADFWNFRGFFLPDIYMRLIKWKYIPSLHEKKFLYR